MTYLVMSEPYHDNSSPFALVDSRDEAYAAAAAACGPSFGASVWAWDGSAFTEVGNWYMPADVGQTGDAPIFFEGR